MSWHIELAPALPFLVASTAPLMLYNAVSGALYQSCSSRSYPVAYISQKLCPTQRKFFTLDRELLAGYLAVKLFQHTISFLCTDYKPLIAAF